MKFSEISKGQWFRLKGGTVIHGKLTAYSYDFVSTTPSMVIDPEEEVEPLTAKEVKELKRAIDL